MPIWLENAGHMELFLAAAPMAVVARNNVRERLLVPPLFAAHAPLIWEQSPAWACRGSKEQADLIVDLAGLAGPVHALQFLSQALLGPEAEVPPPPFWNPPPVRQHDLVVHLGPQIRLPDHEVALPDILREVRWPKGTAFVGGSKDGFLPGYLDLRAENPMAIRETIRRSRIFVGVPSVLAYVAAASGVQTLCVWADAIHPQRFGVHVWKQDDSILNGPAHKAIPTIIQWIETVARYRTGETLMLPAFPKDQQDVLTSSREPWKSVTPIDQIRRKGQKWPR